MIRIEGLAALSEIRNLKWDAVVLNDAETFSSLDGCALVRSNGRVYDLNKLLNMVFESWVINIDSAEVK